MQQLLPVTKIRFPKATPLAKARGIVFVEKLGCSDRLRPGAAMQEWAKATPPAKTRPADGTFAGLVAAVLGLGEGDLDGIFHA